MSKVFISYRNYGDGHAQAVRRLGDLLRDAGLPVALDQFVMDQTQAGPDEGWPKWCADCAKDASVVLVVASQGWLDAWNGDGPPNVGLGSATEAHIFRQYVYENRNLNARLRVVFMDDCDSAVVPIELRAWQSFRPFEVAKDLERLIKWAAMRLNLPQLSVTAVSWPAPIKFDYALADRATEEWPSIVRLLTGHSVKRILMLEGQSGLGKSALIEAAISYAKQVGIAMVHIDLKGGGMDLESVLGLLALDAAACLPEFAADPHHRPHLLRKDLRALRRPLLVVFDHHEDAAGNERFTSWLRLQFLHEAVTSLGLAVIVAGKEVPKSEGQPWRDLAHHIRLKPIDNAKDWQAWFRQHHPTAPRRKSDLELLIALTEGNPATMATYAARLAKR